MNNEDEILEERLRKVRPSAPSPELMARLRSARPQMKPETRRRSVLRFVIPLAAAASLVIGIVIQSPRKEAAPIQTAVVPVQAATDSETPVQMTDCVLAAREVGIYRSPEGKPYRVVQGVGVGQRIWKDAETGEVQTQTFPQQQILLVSLNTF